MNVDEDGVIQTYVYQDIEVQKTGRKAERKLKSGKVDIVVEICPVDSMTGMGKKWVSEDVLFEVTG
jgi:hypothetical protein